MAYDEASHQLIMFGGETYVSQTDRVESLSGTWEWTGRRWRVLHPATQPSARAFAAMAYDPKVKQIVLYGGIALAQSGNGNMSAYVDADTWVWDGHNWLGNAYYRSAPGPLADASLNYDPNGIGGLMLYGGTSSWTKLTQSSTTWEWTGFDWIAASASHPDATSGMSAATDLNAGNVVLFGGHGSPSSNNGASVSQTWTWDGHVWHQVGNLPCEIECEGSPPPRNGASIAYDSAANGVILFGGAGESTLMSDTWIWIAGRWEELHPDVSPPSRFDAAMAYDETTDQLVLFGGSKNINGDRVFGDTWIWKGGSSGTWSRASP